MPKSNSFLMLKKKPDVLGQNGRWIRV